jgi:hypothetical protein
LLLRGFVAGALAVPTFHQAALWLLRLAGLTSAAPWSLAPVPPLGVPALVSAAFWGGIWGAALVLLAPRVARSPALAALFGAVALTFVFWFVVLPVKGLPMGAGFAWPGILVGPIVNGAWGLGTALLLQALGRVGAAQPAAAGWGGRRS